MAHAMRSGDETTACCWQLLPKVALHRNPSAPILSAPVPGFSFTGCTTNSRTSGNDLLDCAAACEASSQCRAFSFVPRPAQPGESSCNLLAEAGSQDDRSSNQLSSANVDATSARCWLGVMSETGVRRIPSHQVLAKSYNGPNNTECANLQRSVRRAEVRYARDHQRSVGLFSWLGRSVSIGIIGGSISVGTGLRPSEESYSQVLGRLLDVDVINRAEGGTGVERPSYCLEHFVPAEVHLEVLIIEYAVNDCHLPLPANAGLERLLRQLHVTRPQTLPLVLYVTPASSWCGALFSAVAGHYGAPELNAAAYYAKANPVSAWDRVVFDAHGHPDARGHALVGKMLADALRARVEEARRWRRGASNSTLGLFGRLSDWSRRPTLPPPTMLSIGLQPSRGWQCRTCDIEGCR